MIFFFLEYFQWEYQLMINLFIEIDVTIYSIYSIVVSLELPIFLTKVDSIAWITFYQKFKKTGASKNSYLVIISYT